MINLSVNLPKRAWSNQDYNNFNFDLFFTQSYHMALDDLMYYTFMVLLLFVILKLDSPSLCLPGMARMILCSTEESHTGLE